ncbi:conserved protein, unknown function [Hepatocystis sp. ex Piliocolobus tephrosceles]|nr:conserved protein, unknown function [Hepatocystis sp. ex Piliocolobus tephrosceles]
MKNINLNKLEKDVNTEKNCIDELDSKIKNIDTNIFLGYHDLKILKLELKNKEIEYEENKSNEHISARNIENAVNKYVLKCYESFLHNLTKNEMELHEHYELAEIEKQKQLSFKNFEKLTTITSIEHLKKINSILLSQNEIINNINKRFMNSLKKMKDNYAKKINLEREKYDKKRQKIIFDLQQEKNENIKKLLAGYNEKILNIQNYFRLILDDQLGIIHALEDDNLIKTKKYFSKKKHLEELNKSISTDGKKLNNLERDVTSLKNDVTYYEKLKTDLKKIKNKRKKQQTILTELKLETDVKKMLFLKLCKQYEDIYNKNKMELYNNLQQMLLENHILETRIKIQNKKFEMNNLELKKWKESLDINENEVLNNFFQNKFQNFAILKKEVEDLIDVQQKNKENYEAILHLNYVPNEDMDILKREENAY